MRTKPSKLFNHVIIDYKSNSNGSCQNCGAKCHILTFNSVLASLTSVFALMVCIKIGCHFNNSMFFIKKNIIKFIKYEMKI